MPIAPSLFVPYLVFFFFSPPRAFMDKLLHLVVLNPRSGRPHHLRLLYALQLRAGLPLLFLVRSSFYPY